MTEPFSPHERIDALERLLRELLICLEHDTAFDSADFVQWLQMVRSRERAHGIAVPRQHVALGELAERVLELSPPAAA